MQIQSEKKCFRLKKKCLFSHWYEKKSYYKHGLYGKKIQI